MAERTSAEKVGGVLTTIFAPTGPVFPILLILGLPAVLCLSIASPRSLLGYPTVLRWTLVWIGIPGQLLLPRIVPWNVVPQDSIGEVLLVYALPLIVLGTVFSLVLIKRSEPKRRAIWLGFAWSTFALQLIGTIPMAYLWAIGV